ncbi:uncharacterized protein B0H18DRAFT_886495 [Fomitopsis serialis]|uniref:uncharacterized protein n=1 Tax=Fomitopsis serialis TaxID=139415 RepID=UPI002007D0BC|nr:uncharacterized protein B0H18DRAFT_886495 [Neoantrodia serialis]KAH9914946.1 hypothetical protein B0H18DRAFT_886495 [Neoantrodia serialis]
MVQMAIYASEMLSVEGMIRDHGLGMLTQDDWTWIWYFDSAGAIQAQGFNILAHTADFVLVLMLLQRFKLPQWGFPPGTNSEARLNVVRGLALPRDVPRDEIPAGPAGSTRTMPAQPAAMTFEVVGTSRNGVPKTMVVDPQCVLHKPSPILKGRRTTVLEAQDPDMPTMSYVAKWSYPQTTRHNEAETVWIAREIVEEMGKEVLGTLTDVAAFKDFAHLSTDDVRGHLRLFSDSTRSLIDAEHHGERILRCIFEEKLKPLTYLAGLEFVRGMIDCIYCHMLLWIGNDRYRIEHTDISFWNLGVDLYSLCIRVRDFDLARVVVVGQPSIPQGSERTGTIPFMALDLLTDAYWKGHIERLYRHDLEAFVWVALYYAWAFDDEGLEDMDSPVRDWLTADYVECYDKKSNFLMSRTGQLPDWRTRTSADTPLGYALSFARLISQWLLGEHTQRRRAADPQVDALDPFARKNHPSRSHDDELEQARRDFDNFWVDIGAIRIAVKGVEATPERVEYFKLREKKVEELMVQRKTEEDRLNREAEAEERERKKVKKEAEQEARDERDRLLKLQRKVNSAL